MKIHNKFSLAINLFCIVLTLLQHSCQGQNSPQDYLNAHNAARAQYGLEAWYGMKGWQLLPETMSSRLGDCNLVHSTNRPYGENLAKGSGDFTGRAAVNLWVAERPNYNYGSNSCVGGVSGHYTQVVWRNSVRLGCARARCNNGRWFISCNYDPPGNVIGQRPY